MLGKDMCGQAARHHYLFLSDNCNGMAFLLGGRLSATYLFPKLQKNPLISLNHQGDHHGIH